MIRARDFSDCLLKFMIIADIYEKNFFPTNVNITWSNIFFFFFFGVISLKKYRKVVFELKFLRALSFFRNHFALSSLIC